jgi:hypothetical protein
MLLAVGRQERPLRQILRLSGCVYGENEAIRK